MQTRGKAAKGKEFQGFVVESSQAARVAKDSPVSSQSTASSLKVDPVKVGQLAWVQCENELCQKWRVISQEEAERLRKTDQSWFCSMNTNMQYNSCEQPQEKFLNDKVVRRFGYRIIHNILPEGSLVWARMPGHVRWPAILSSWAGVYVEKDRDGDPTFYHVEFLGKSHTQYWVHSRNIQAYAECLKPEPPQKPCRGFRFKKKKSMTSAGNSRHNVAYYHKLEESVQEAETLKDLTCSERLQRCVFKYERNDTPCGEIEEENQEDTGQKLHPTCDRRVKQTDCVKLPQHTQHLQLPQKKRGRPPKNFAVTFSCNAQKSQVTEQNGQKQMMQQKLQNVVDKCCKKKKVKKQKKKKKKSKHKKHKKTKQHMGDHYDPYRWPDTQQGYHDVWNPLYAPITPTPHPQMVQNMQYGSQATVGYSLQQAQMISKEERLQADIQSLKRDEQEFHNSLTRFLTSKGLSQRKSPCWQGRQVSLYQLFMAVQERGGFHKVCAVTGAWRNIYQDVTNSIMKAGSFGDTARKYYQRNLLPYELSCIKRTHRSPSRTISNCQGLAMPMPQFPEQTVLSLTNNQNMLYCVPKSPSIPVDPSALCFGPGLPDAKESPARLKTVSCSFTSGSSSASFGLTVPHEAMSPSIGFEDRNGDGSKHHAEQDCLSDVADLLDDEVEQTMEEIEMIKSLLAADECLDRPTHTVPPICKPSPLSSKKPFEFYSLDYQSDATTRDMSLSKKYIDDTHIVPNTYVHSEDSPSQSLLHASKKVRQADKEVLQDMDQLVQDIDLLDQELDQQWMEI